MQLCPSCGEENPERFRGCGTCGAQLRSAPRVEGRQIVTVVVSDLKGSTSLGEALDPESLREVMSRYVEEMGRVLESHGGTIEKIIGDAIVAAFGLPAPRPDDALRAVQAAAAMERQLAALNEELERVWGVRLTNRTGVSTGEVVVAEPSAGQHVLTGEAIAVASWLEQNAPALETLVDGATLRAAGDVAVVEEVEPILDGLETMPAYRLVSVGPTSEPEGPRGERHPARPCPNCGEEIPERFARCGFCGARVSSGARAREARKTVTIVFSDLKASTTSGRPLGPEAFRDVMSQSFDVLRRILEYHGGTVEKFIGDAVMAVFGLPQRHEDDALRAVRAALEMKHALAELNEELERLFGANVVSKTGVNTGPVITGDASTGQRLVTGDAVNVAARLEQAAGAMEILLGDLTYRLARNAVEVEPVEPLTLKGKAEPVPAYRLRSVRGEDVLERRRDAPIVGRERELAELAKAFDEVASTRSCRLVTLLAEAGVGKSRLVDEFLRQIAGDARAVRGRCLPYGKGITFWPLAEVVREAALIRDGDSPDAARAKLSALLVGQRDVAERVAGAIGLSESQFSVDELFWGARRLLESLARERPLVVVFEDVHWAETTFLDLVEHLSERVDASVLLVCAARPDLLDRREGWGQGERACRVAVEPLSDADSARVIENLLGASIGESARARIVESAQGNPLFVEQMLSMLVESGLLSREREEWVATADLADVSVPPTIEALLAARLDGLPRSERGVLEPASVAGQRFPLDALDELVDEELRLKVRPALSTLTGKQLVRPDVEALAAWETYRFQHILIRDAAYEGLLKRERVRLHERFVTWGDRVNRERGREVEFEEILGYHLEQAYRYLAELGPLNEHGRAIGADAARRLSSAGRRAVARGDMPAAANLLRRAAELLPERDPQRLELLPDLGEALVEIGEFACAEAFLDQAVEAAAAAGDLRLAADATVVRLRARRHRGDAAEWEAEVMQVAEQAIPIFEAARDHARLARTLGLVAFAHGHACRFAQAGEMAVRAMRQARLAGDRRREAQAASAYAEAALYGPTSVPEAIVRCEEALAQAAGVRLAEGLITCYLAPLFAMQGDFQRGRSLYASARATLEEIGGSLMAASTSLDSSVVEMLGGDLEAAERELRRDHDTLERLDETYLRSTIAGHLARVVEAQGRAEEAEALTRISEDLSAEDDVMSQALWRSVRARVLARRGQFDEAEALAREAVELLRTTDIVNTRAQALLDLGDVLQGAKRHREGSAALEEALRLLERKGNLVGASSAGTLLVELLSQALAAGA